MTLTITFERFNKNNIFIETGSLFGCGIKRAIAAGYKKIISIELAEYYYQFCKSHFSQYGNRVEIVHGDSGKILGDVINKFNEPMTFWLDGHYSGGSESGVPETAGANVQSPLMAELEFIRNHPIKTHAILVDDLEPEMEEIIKHKIFQINPEYTIEYVSCPVDSNATLYKTVLLAYIWKF